MDYYIPFPLLISIISLILTTLFFIKNSPNKLRKSKLPPGPKPWPIIGNMHQLGNKPHHYVASLSRAYGPIMSLKLGSVTTIVISSPNIAKEMFLKHDLDFSSRKVPVARRVVNHDHYSMIWLPICHKWRNLRKIATMQLFTKQKLDFTQHLRQMKVHDLVEYVRDCCEHGIAVDIGKAGFTTLLNLMSNTLFSKDLASHDSSCSDEFKNLVWNLLEEGSKLNISDFFPIFELLDLQGIMKRNTDYLEKMLRIFEGIIDERLGDQMVIKKDDVLDTLLNLVQNNEVTIDDVKHLVMDFFLAGSDTTFSTLEWAMTELLHNKEKMTKAQIELDQVLDKTTSIQESDISKLPYIQAIVKETLRLHPPAPILIPHKAEKDVELSGYLVPKNSEIWVNVWSIGRDPSLWPDPNSFSPERFLEGENNTDVKGQDFKLIPFGAGRRMCPGMPLAYRMVHLMLGTLLYSFNWKMGDGYVEDIDIDGQETFGLSMQRLEPLRIVPVLR